GAWREELEIKFFSQIYPVRAFKPLLDKSDAAAILAVSSLLAYQPEPYMVATAAARAGAQSLIKSLAREFAPRIRVNSVMLGLVDSGQWERRFAVRKDPGQTRAAWYAEIARTRQIPLERLGRPEEGARAIAFLCSPAAGFIPGAQLEIPGAPSRHMCRDAMDARALACSGSARRAGRRPSRPRAGRARRDDGVRRDLDPQHADPRCDSAA